MSGASLDVNVATHLAFLLLRGMHLKPFRGLTVRAAENPRIIQQDMQAAPPIQEGLHEGSN